MTLDEFRRNHPGCQVGRASPTFPLVMAFFCVGVVVLMVKYLINYSLAEVQGPREILAPIGAVCLTFSFSIGSWIIAQRLVEVLGWIRKGYCCFAVADTEALLVGEKGESVLIPVDQIAEFGIHVHTITLKMKPGFPQANELSSLVSSVLQPGGDGPGGRAFFKALAPVVQKHAPDVKVSNKEADPLF